MASEIEEAEWKNEANWTLPIGIYFSKKDPRWLVPKRTVALGWTFNLATKKGAWAWLLCFLAPSLILAMGIVVQAWAVGLRCR